MSEGTGAAAGRRPLVVGNWKMHLSHLEAIGLVQKIVFTLSPAELAAVEVVVLPPFTALRSVQTLVDGDDLGLGYGAQDLSPHPDGPYTGDISATMLTRLGCRYALVGHSERRDHHGEDDATVAAKLRAARNAGLAPLLCVGEPLSVRRAGEHLAFVQAQLAAALAGLAAADLTELTLAYEPIWAIGTGEVASPGDAQEAAAALRASLRAHAGPLAETVRILYGGSVTPASAAELFAGADVDGGLIGGASLDAESFAAICRAAGPG